MKSSQRRSEILKIVEARGKVNVEELIKPYDVSIETIRRDLRILDERGFVKRTYGGAARLVKSIREIPYGERLEIQRGKKEAIALEAIKLIEDRDCIFLDGKTTCLAICHAIPAHMKLTVVTNSIYVALHFIKQNCGIKVFMVGGEVNGDGMTEGPRLYQEIINYRFDRAFISCIGLTQEGCFYSKTEPYQLAQVLKEVSSQVVLVADSSKVGEKAFLLGLKIDEMDVLVTDSEVPATFINKVGKSVKKLVVAQLEDDEGKNIESKDFLHRSIRGENK